MKVVTSAGDTFDLGATEATPTVTLKDYSRRVTDEFGVTTVVPRGFSRQLSVRLKVPADGVDALQRRLADLRAASALWVADARYAALSVTGFFKDFSLDIPNAAIASCTLTVEGLAEVDAQTDTGGDPAPNGQSTLRVLRPITVTDAALVSSSVAETDYAAWSSGTSYGKGARVILAATHRIYESVVDSNAGNDPAGSSGKWLNIGPTNRWAMFDQALGSTTEAQGSIAVTLTASSIRAVALLDVIGATVRVQTTSYDHTTAVAAGAITFLDLPANTTRATVTIAGSGTVSVGTLLAGVVVDLGATEASPSAGITDYSRKDTDEFGEVTIVPRSWAKRMDLKAAIATAAIDNVFARIAAVRAMPVLWIGGRGLDALTIYGFYKSASIEIGKSISKLSLSIEGLSTAGKVEPFAPGGGSVAWPDITDPAGTKPTDNADKTSLNTSKDTAAVAGKPATQVISDITSVAARALKLETETIPAVNKAVADAGGRITTAQGAADAAKGSADSALARISSEVTRLDGRIDSVSAGGGYDDTKLKAEVKRVDEAAIGRDAALGSRVDTVSASLTSNDTNLRALIQTKEQAAVDRENAISKRVDDIIAEGGGGGDGADTIARAEIQRVEQASITRDSALGSRVDTIQASVDTVDSRIAAKAQEVTTAYTQGDQALASRASVLEAAASATSTSVVPNDNFNIWADGQALPSRWGYWAVGGSFRVERGSPGRGGGQYCVVTLNDATGVESGFVQTIYSSGPGKWVVEVTIGKTHGYLSGAGLLVGNQPLDFLAEPDIKDQTRDSGDGEVRSWTKLIDLDVGDTINVHAMHGWRGFGRTIMPKYIAWHCLRLRPANDAEIKAGKADAALFGTGGVLARIATTEATIADLPNQYAAASRASKIEAQLGRSLPSGLSDYVDFVSGKADQVRTDMVARIEERATAIADSKVGAVTQSVSNLRSEYNGTAATVSRQAGTIVDLQSRASAYIKLVADAGNGVGSFSLWSDQYGGAWELAGNGRIRGNLVLDGTLTGAKIASDAIAGFGTAEAGSLALRDTAVTEAAVVNYPSSGGRAAITFSGIITLSPGAPAGTRLSAYLSLNGAVKVGPLPLSATRGSPVPFCFTTLADLSGSQRVVLAVQATAGVGSGDPHIIDAPTIVLTEFKKLGV